jgi:hypothetical protein
MQTPITAERHAQLGKELFLIRETLLRLYGELNSAGAPMRHMGALTRGMKGVDDLRKHLNDDLQELRPGPNDRTYYGNPFEAQDEIDQRLPRAEHMKRPKGTPEAV